MTTKHDVVVSGMRPTGRLHLGNYWGALRNWIELSGKYQCLFFVADWHMLTTGYEDTSKLQDNIREMVLDWLAAGLDPAKCVIFKQSDVPEHAELALLLSMITPLSWLENNPTWKEQLQELAKTKESKIREDSVSGHQSGPEIFIDLLQEFRELEKQFLKRNLALDFRNYLVRSADEKFTAEILVTWAEGELREHPDLIRGDVNRNALALHVARLKQKVIANPNAAVSVDEYGRILNKVLSSDESLRTHGFIGYPVLQAADVLIYKGSKVPVGQDQLPHLELSREIARKFNSIYGPVLPEPQPIITQTPKLPGNDGRKMSKSYGNTIELLETPESLSKKVMGMYTDPGKLRKDTPGHPDPSPENPPGCVVYALHKLYTPGWEKIGEDCRAGKLGCVQDKRDLLLPNLEKSFSAFREARKRYESDPKLVQSILDEGGRKARAIAQQTMAEVRRAMRLA